MFNEDLRGLEKRNGPSLIQEEAVRSNVLWWHDCLLNDTDTKALFQNNTDELIEE